MPTSTKVKNLNINELTEAQYDAAVQGGVIGANELSVLTDVSYVEPSDLATVATTGDYSDLINRPTNLVSTNTAQTISGMKTFSGDITLSGTTSIKNNTGGTNYTMLYRDASTIHVGASTSVLKLEGSGTRPAYNNDSLALLSDVTGGLPSQTGNAGKFLTTDGTDASWAEALTNKGTGFWAWASGASAQATGGRAIALGAYAKVGGEHSIGIIPVTNTLTPFTAKYTIAIGSFNTTTGFADKKFYVGFGTANNGYELLDGTTGTIPEARLADTTNATQGQVLTLDSTNNAVWATPSGGGATSATGTLTTADWSSNTQTINVTGVTSSNNVIVAPAPASQSDYTAAGIVCTAQGSGTLTFACQTTPSSSITVNVLIM